MTKPVLLGHIIDALNAVSIEISYYLDKENAKVLLVSDEEMSLAETDSSIDEIPEWQREGVEVAKRVLEEHENLIPLPDQFEIDERSIMFQFTYTLKDSETRDKLLQALHGKRPYRHFKDTVYALGLSDGWHAFKDKALKEIAIEWCEVHNVQYIEIKR